MAAVTAQDGDANAKQRDNHGHNGRWPQLLSQGEPGHQGSADRSQGHEQLAKLGADDDIALKQAVVTDDVTHQTR